jgi:hypothetical protein
MTAPGSVARKHVTWPNSYLEMAGRTRAIVRLDKRNRVVTKGYQGYRKGVYDRVTKGIGRRDERLGPETASIKKTGEA